MMRIIILLLVPLLVLGSSSENFTSEKIESEVSGERSQPNEDSVKLKREPQLEIYGHLLNNNIGGKDVIGTGAQSFINEPHANVQSSGFISGLIGGLNQGGVGITQGASVGHVKPVNIAGNIGGLGLGGLGHSNAFNNAGSSNLGGGGLAHIADLGSLSGINFGFSNTQDPSLFGGNAASHVLDSGTGGGFPQGNFGGGATMPILFVLSGSQLPFSFNSAGLGALHGGGGFTELNSVGGQGFGQHGGFLPADLQHSLGVQHSHSGFGNLGHSFDLGGQGTHGQGSQGTFGQGGVDFTGENFVGSGGFNFGNLGLIGRSLGVGETTFNFGNQGLETSGGGFYLGGGQGTFGQGGQGTLGHGVQGTLGYEGQGNFGQGGQATLGQEGQGTIGQGGQGTFGQGGVGHAIGSFVDSGGFNFGNQGLTSGSFGVGGPTFNLGNQDLGNGGAGFSLGGGEFNIGQGVLSNVGGQSLFFLDPSQYGYGINSGNIKPQERGLGFISQGGSNLAKVGLKGGGSPNSYFLNQGRAGFPIRQDISGGSGTVGLHDRLRFGSGSGIISGNRGKDPVKFHGRGRNEYKKQRYGISSPTIVRGLLTGQRTDDGIYKKHRNNHLPQVIPRHFERYSRRPSYNRFRRKKNVQKNEEKEQKELAESH